MSATQADIRDLLLLVNTAIHEAAHAVVAQRLGIGVLYATLKPRGHFDGHVGYADEGKVLTGIKEMWHDVVVAMAGTVAERRWRREGGTVETDEGCFHLCLSQEQLDQGMQSDLQAFDGYRAVLDDAQVERLVVAARQSAAWYVGQCWEQIGLLAARLIEEETVRF